MSTFVILESYIPLKMYPNKDNAVKEAIVKCS